MYDVIKRFCNNEHSNGLMLLDMPTGTGKTFSVVKYIFDAAQDTSDKRKYFFITSQIKNLPEEELQGYFEKAGQLTTYREKVLRVKANAEGVREGLTEETKKHIPKEIKDKKEYTALVEQIKLLDSLKGSNDPAFRAASETYKDKLQREIEPNFRRMLQGHLAKKFPTAEKRRQAIKTDKNWQWVAALYPSVFMKDRQVVVMSVDKFLSKNSTIVEPPCMLYNSPLIDGAIIFIDEFDATKETVLKHIIDDGLRDKVDYVDLFNAAYSGLQTHSLPAMLTTPSKRRLEGKYKDQPLQEMVKRTIGIADDVREKFCLQYSHKTENVTDDNVNNFLFQDHRYHSILNGGKSFIAAVTDHKEKINLIRFLDERPGNDSKGIHHMLWEIRGSVSYFMKMVYVLAINYQECRRERNPGRDAITTEESIRTVLADFKLTTAYINYLTAQILGPVRRYKGGIQTEAFDLSFYQNGFRYFSFEDDYNHDTLSKIMMYSFCLTPEKMLLRFCERAKVLGVSATATIPSVIGNYDIEYLQEKLQGKYIEITPEERERLAEDFRALERGYDDIQIHTELIGEEVYSVEAWRQVCDNEEMAQYLFNRINTACSSDNKHYNEKRYLRIAAVFERFLRHRQIKSLLCVLTKHPRKDDGALNLVVLREIFEVIAKYYGVPFDFDKNVAQLDGGDFDSKKEEVISRLGAGERVFVISVYQTIGAGQNLQYPIPAEIQDSLIKTNDRPQGGQKDFDAIYLDKPTYVLPVLNGELGDKDFVKYLFYIEMLQENAEISVAEATAHIKKGFRCFSRQDVANDYAVDLYKCRSVKLLYTRLVIQAIGRICRTNMKSREIFVFADRELAKYLDPRVCENRQFNREFRALVAAVEGMQKEEKPRNQRLKDAAQLTSARVNKYIHSMLQDSWGDEDIARWKELRQVVLKHPTLSRDQFDSKGIARHFYVELEEAGNQLFYKQKTDFNEVEVFFKKEGVAHLESEETSRLTLLMKEPFLKEYFAQNGWATAFAPNQYIMAPPLFNNIYRGALGEVAGKALFEKLTTKKLIDIEDKVLFEKFDYVVEGSSVFVDFKNWHERTFKPSDQELKHIGAKAKDCGASCVIIANIFAENKHAIRRVLGGDVEILIVPALLESDGDGLKLVESAWQEIRRSISDASN